MLGVNWMGGYGMSTQMLREYKVSPGPTFDGAEDWAAWDIKDAATMAACGWTDVLLKQDTHGVYVYEHDVYVYDGAGWRHLVVVVFALPEFWDVEVYDDQTARATTS